MLTGAGAPVWLLDVDNTLLDNDRFSAELDARLERELGPEGRRRYRAAYEALRAQHGYADYLAPLQQLRRELEDDPALLRMAGFLLDYPFAELLYPGALAAIAHLRSLGTVAILSDGDMVLQPRKIQRSGLWDAVDGAVLLCLHKERTLAAVQRRWPGRALVLVDDKPRLLAAAKSVLGDALTTVFVRQGHYAAEAAPDAPTPRPDLRLERIGELARIDAAWRAAPPQATIPRETT